MPFNSFQFVLIFLPGALLVYYACALTRLHRLRLPILILLTLVFYAKAAARQLPLLAASVALNYACARLIDKHSGRKRTLILTIGVAMNVAVLLYFKYTGFLVANFTKLSGFHAAAPHILLPLAISFYTFQQIAFLVDVSRGIVKPAHPLGYAGSILFFPFIISGPITFYREVGPQLVTRPDRSAVMGNILVGLVLFSLGLFKKTVLADSYALWVDPMFAAASAGETLGASGAWSATTAYLLQIYFDFSGYSDMALGIARMLGILLPINFFSPIRCTSIIDYWRRWHITLGRFVNAYIFLPISVPLSRWAAMRGYGRNGLLVIGTLAPTVLTMIIIGAWHGGNWTFMLFGALHGFYMATNEAWRFFRRKKRKGKPVLKRHVVQSNLLTMVAVIFALVSFRSPNVAIAANIWSDMTGVRGGLAFKGAWPVLGQWGGYPLLGALIVGFGIAYLLPNTQQFVGYEPALEWAKWREVSPPYLNIKWRPHVGWSLLIGAIFLAGFAFVGRGSTSFVYFGF